MLLLSIFICLAFYIIGAYSTTDIIRLTSKTSLSVSDHSCYCLSCGHPLSPSDQIPIISYIVSRGECRYCNKKISSLEFILECFFTISLSLIALITSCSAIGFVLIVALYESIKFLLIYLLKPRHQLFVKELCLSLLHNVLIFFIIGILFLFHHIIEAG